MPYPVELYKDHFYRLVHGPEEHQQMVSDGWSEDRPEGHKYIPVSAMNGGPSPEPAKRGPGRPPIIRTPEPTPSSMPVPNVNVR